MKLFCVTTERDGATTRKPGESSTEVLQYSHYYAAETIQDVWEAIAWMRNDPETTVRAIAEVVSGITVLPANTAPTQGGV